MTAALPVLHLSPESRARQLGEEITLLAGQINAATYRLLKLVAEFDAISAWSGGGTVRSCAHWLNWKCGIAMGAAREKVRVAQCLQHLPLIDAAFASGQISYSKVRAMTRVATADNEEFLLMIAQHGTASHMEKLVGKYQTVQRSMQDKAERERECARQLYSYQDDDGMWIIHAKLPPEEGSLVIKAIEAVAESIRADAEPAKARHVESVQDDAISHRAARQNVSAETFSNEVNTDATDGHCINFEQSRADALVSMAEHCLATAGDAANLQSLKGSERCQVMLHVDVHTLRNRAGAAPGPSQCHLDEQPWISAETSRRLSCDASLVTVLEDGRGNVLNIGRRARTVPPALRRALAIRDKTCRFPGCCEARYVDAHHIQHWADGGDTSLDNLVTLCRFHHRQLHRGCFTIRVESASHESPQLVFVAPSGTRITASFFPQFPPEVAADAGRALARAAPDVDAQTCVTRWQGEVCDYDMAVGALCARSADA